MKNELRFLMPAIGWLFIATLQVSAAPTASDFFRLLFKQQPNSWFAVNEENTGQYSEKISGGKFITKQSFLLVDPYATGKERYLKPIATEALAEYMPETAFFYGELSCNFEFNNGNLPFIGYTDGKSAGIIVHPSYDIMDARTQSLLASVTLKRQGQMENYALELARLFARVRMKKEDCNAGIEDFSKAEMNWKGEVLDLKLPYLLKCKQDNSNEWGPKAHVLELKFNFMSGKLTDFTVVTWP